MNRQRLNVVMAALLAVLSIGLLLSPRGRIVGRCAVGNGFSAVSLEPHDFEGDFFGFRWAGNTENYIDAEVERFGAYELPVLFAMEDGMKAVAGGRPAVAVDVGANIGHHALFLSRSADTVIAVEPFPPVIERMRSLLEANGVENVRIHEVGYAAEPGSLPFHEPLDSNTGVGTFEGSRPTGATRVRDLPLARGDEDLADIGAIHVLKIDIEGYERPALEGLRATLEHSRPAVVMELNVAGEFGYRDEATLRSSFPEDYAFFRIGEPPRIEWTVGRTLITCAPDRQDYYLEPYDMAFERDGHNLLILPKEHVARFEDRIH